MINAPRGTFLCFRRPFLTIPQQHTKWVSSNSIPQKDHHHHLITLLRESKITQSSPTLELSIVSALKTSSSSSLSSGEQIHALALKSGLERSNIFIRNGLINLYGKSGSIADARILFQSSPLLDLASWNIMIGMYVRSSRLDDARSVFDQMPVRDCVSFTSMVMGLSQNHHFLEALELFGEMAASGIKANEVTLACVISACSRIKNGVSTGRSIHALAVKEGLHDCVLVSTNLVHFYSVFSSLEDSQNVFDRMPERNTVTWNAMLNGYAKAGLIHSAQGLFGRIPIKDLVSWSTMIDGYLRVFRLREALLTYSEMLQSADYEIRPNEVMVGDLLSSCGRLSAIGEGRQFHGIILKTGFDGFAFMQATIIHFYAGCQQIDLACLQFRLGNKDNVSSWNALVNGYIRNNMMDSARKLFDEMPERDIVSWSTLIAGYAQTGHPDLALHFFNEMQIQGMKPNEITMVSVLSAVANSGKLEHGRWIHNYITENSIPLNDNLSAGLIDMYAKCASVVDALQLFNQLRYKTTSICPWNAVICGLAMHGHADISLRIFSELQNTNTKPNSITFIGVLSACCHGGLLAEGKQFFESMKIVYKIEPNIKHYGCMVDLLGRAGLLQEALQLIESMPMKADVVIWGTLLAASRNHGDVKMGEKAAESLARLEPDHGAGKVLLSNIYADAGRWNDVLSVRCVMQSRKLKKLPGCSGVV